MRKTTFLLLMFPSILFLPVISVHADDEPALSSQEPRQMEKQPLQQQRPSTAAVKRAAQDLVDLEGKRVEDRIRDLERQMEDIERDRRFQDERIRNLERTVNDLRRGQR